MLTLAWLYKSYADQRLFFNIEGNQTVTDVLGQDPPIFTIIKRTHHFEVIFGTPSAREIANKFSMGLVSYKLVPAYGTTTRVMDKIYAASNKTRSYVRYHINSYVDFMKHVANHGISPSQIKLEVVPVKETPTVKWEMFEHLSARDYQESFIEYGVRKTPVSKLIQLQTGKGKSFIACSVAQRLQARICLMIKANYIDKWKIDFKKTFKLEDDEIFVIQGSSSLKKGIDLVKKGKFTAKVIIVSIPTYQAWINLFEELGQKDFEELGYSIVPDEFFEYFNVKLKIIDEVHQHFHFCFKTDLYTHVEHSICLTATLTHKEAFMRKMYNLMFPIQDRCAELEYDRYCNIFAVHAEFRDITKVKTNMYGNPMFSYVAVENSIRKNKFMTAGYLDMLTYTVRIGFDQCKREKKKLLIFVSTIEMIGLFINHLQKTHRHLDIKPYHMGQPFENVLNSDICVSTLGSAGTAIDIPDLTHCILTQSVDSEQANLQSIGRLRKLPDGYTPEFYYWVFDNIPISVRYHDNKTRLLKNRALNQIYVRYDAYIGDHTPTQVFEKSKPLGAAFTPAQAARPAPVRPMYGVHFRPAPGAHRSPTTWS
jgi:hypothetical protein